MVFNWILRGVHEHHSMENFSLSDTPHLRLPETSGVGRGRAMTSIPMVTLQFNVNGQPDLGGIRRKSVGLKICVFKLQAGLLTDRKRRNKIQL